LPDRPRTDPGVPFSSTGLFENTRFRIRLQKDEAFLAIASSEVSIAVPALRRRTMFPLPASYFRQPLPLVSGATVSEYYELI
jgi:hypothetical protein